MKKIVAIFFLFIYGFTTVGATLNQHFCMGEYIGSNIYHSEKEECGKCGMKTAKSNDCCQDKHQFIQLKREHSQATVAADVPVFFNEITIPDFSLYKLTPLFNRLRIATHFYSPPDIYKHRLHLLNGVFLI